MRASEILYFENDWFISLTVRFNLFSNHMIASDDACS